MSNPYRGETPFQALGREMFLAYRTPELAAMQQALGFAQPDPLVRSYAEQLPALNLITTKAGVEHATDADGRLLAALNSDGSPRLRTVIVDVRERRRRIIEGFDAALLQPTADELLKMVRCGLAPWESKNAKLTAAEFDELVLELGFIGLSELHQKTLANSYRVMLPESQDDSGGDPNAQSPESVSQT
jgi:hypothetical protein